PRLVDTDAPPPWVLGDREGIEILQGIQREIKEALKVFKEGGTWEHTLPFQINIDPFHVGIKRSEDYISSRMRGFFTALWEAGQYLRRCARCKNLFVKTKRQEYCSTNCSQIVRNEKKKRIKEERKAKKKPK